MQIHIFDGNVRKLRVFLAYAEATADQDITGKTTLERPGKPSLVLFKDDMVILDGDKVSVKKPNYEGGDIL